MTTSNPNRSSYIEEEIEVKPSTELIPDEYEHFTKSNQTLHLHTFTSNTDADRESETTFLTTMDSFGYSVTKRHCLDKDNLRKELDEILENCKDDTGGVILFFSGLVTENNYLISKIQENCIQIQQIWLGFNSHKNKFLQFKPKIFILNLTVKESLVQWDGSKKITAHPAYDPPAEADILVICNKSKGDFLYQFCENVKEYGDTESIITLASCVEDISPPIIVSTLTRNFYFNPSNSRGNNAVIEKLHKDIKTEINTVRDTIDKLMVDTMKKKKKPSKSIFSSFRINKKQKDDDKKDNDDSTTITHSDIPKPSVPVNINKPTSTTQSRRSSGPSYQRKMSQSEPDNPRLSAKKKPDKNENRKQPWKP